MRQGQHDWAALIHEVETAVTEGVDPSSERAAGLAARWGELIKGFTGGDPEIQAGLNKMYSDQTNWPRISPNHLATRLGLSCVKR